MTPSTGPPESVRVLPWREVATTDGLIGRWKRRHLGKAIEQALEHSHRNGEPLVLALVPCDSDPFKVTNARKDHPASDQVLIELLRGITVHQRSGNGFGRWGGEGLLLLLPQSDGTAATTLAETLRGLIRATPSPSAGSVSASSDVALGLEQEALLAWLMGAARGQENEGVYAAQRRGCNGGVVAPGPGASSRGLRCTSIGVP